MRNKRFLLIIAIVLLLVFMMSFTLMACVKKQQGGDNTESGDIDSGETDSGEIKPPEVQYPSYIKRPNTALEYIIQSASGEYASVVLSGGLEINSEKYVFDVKMNISETDTEMSLKVKNEATDSVLAAVYVTDSKLFVQTSDGTIYHISEIDTDYLLSIIDKLPAELKKLIEDALSSIGNFTLDTIIDLIIPMVFSTSNYKNTYTSTGEGANKVENIVVDITLQKFIKGIDSILGLLGGSIDFDTSLIKDVLALVPKVDGQIKATVKGGVMSDISLSFISTEGDNAGEEVFDISSAISFGDKGIDLEIPENIKDYEEFSLTNLNADFTLNIDTGDSGLDLGALIDSFMPQPIFGSGVLVLKAGVDYKLQAKVNLDANLEGKAEDNNLISLALSAGDKVFAKVNYYEGKFYINIEDQIKIAIEYDLASQITKLVDAITKAIDGALGTEFKSSDVDIASISLNENGDAIISSDIRTVISKILGVVGFSDYIFVNANDIQIKINQGLIDKITELANVDAIKFPLEANILVQLASNGIDYVEISALDNALKLKGDNFLIGTSDLTKENVLADIGDTSDYGSDAASIVNSLLSDFSAKVKLDLSSIDTTVNLTNLINNIMVVSGQSLNLPLTLDLSNYSGIFTLNFAIHQGDATIDNRLLLELITPDGDVLMSLYIYDGRTYVDLSNLGFMKFVIINADLFDFVKEKLGLSVASETETVALASSDINLDNTSVSVALKSELVLAFMRMLMFDAGLDVNVNAEIDMSGVLNATLDAGFMALDLNIVTGRESDDPININNVNRSEYTEVDAINADMLVEGIFSAQNFNLMIDFYNNNCDTLSNNETRIVLRKSSAEKGKTETLPNGLSAPYNSLVLGIYYNWSNLNDDSVLLWGVIDVDAGKVQIRGTKRLINYGVVDGTVVDIPINNIDIKGMLAGALAGLFGESSGSGNGGGIIDVPEGALPDKNDQSGNSEESVQGGLDVGQLIEGIDLKMTSSLDIKADIDFNGTMLSDFLNETIKTVFTDMDLTSVTGSSDPVTINYDNKNANVFFEDLYSKVITPAIKNMDGGSLILGIAEIVGLKESVMHSLVRRFLPLPDFDDLTVSVNLTQGKLDEIDAIATNEDSERGFGAYIFNRNAQDVISWQGQDLEVYYNKNVGINPQDLFVKQAKKQGSGHSSNFYQDIAWSVNGETISDWSVLNSYGDGEYTVVGSAFGSQISVKLTIESCEIDHVEDVVLLAMREVPDYITVVFTDGSKRVLYDQTINYTRGAYDSTEEFKVLPASVVLGGKTYDFNIILENETVTIDPLTVNVFDYKDVFAEMTETKLKVKIKDSFYRYVDAEFDFSQFDGMTKEDLMKGGVFYVPVLIGKGSDIEQTVTMEVRFTPFEVYGIEIDGKNYVDTDVYDYIAGKSFPETVTVVGFDGEKEVRYQAKASWDTSNVTIDKQGGQYIASVTLNQGEYNEWYLPAVGVNVNYADLKGLVNDTIVLDTMYYFYGGVTFDRLVPDFLDFYTENGEIKERVPVTIDTSAITPDIKGGKYECKVTVGEGDYKFETTVNVVLPDVTMSLIEDEISFTYEEYLATNGSVLDYRMAIKLGENQVTAKVTWFTDNVVFDTPGTYIAYVIIDEGGEYEQTCEIKVTILASEEV